MKKLKTKNKKYPYKLILTNGAKILVPKQGEFSTPWLKHHGCSLVAEFIALQFIGVYRKWPNYLLKWHKKHTPNDVEAKVTVRGVAKGINKIAKGKGKAVYHKTLSEDQMRATLKAGNLIILEQKDPIHSIVLVYDNKKLYMISYGKITRTSVAKIRKTATSNDTYRGMVVVKRLK